MPVIFPTLPFHVSYWMNLIHFPLIIEFGLKKRKAKRVEEFHFEAFSLPRSKSFSLWWWWWRLVWKYQSKDESSDDFVRRQSSHFIRAKNQKPNERFQQQKRQLLDRFWSLLRCKHVFAWCSSASTCIDEHYKGLHNLSVIGYLKLFKELGETLTTLLNRGLR